MIAFLVGSGVVLWVIALPILTLVTIAVVRGVKQIRVERRTSSDGIEKLVRMGTADIEQFLKDGGAS